MATDNAVRKVKAEYNKLGQKNKTIADSDGAIITVQYTYDLPRNQQSKVYDRGGQLV